MIYKAAFIAHMVRTALHSTVTGTSTAHLSHDSQEGSAVTKRDMSKCCGNKVLISISITRVHAIDAGAGARLNSFRFLAVPQ